MNWERWTAILFGILFGMWVGADRYVGLLDPIELPIAPATIAYSACLVSIGVIAWRDRKAALRGLIIGIGIIAVTDRVWKYALDSGDPRKLVAIQLLNITPLIVVVGLLVLVQNWRRTTSSAPVK